MAKIPSCLVAHFDRALQLIGADSFFGFAHQIGCDKPLRQGQMRIMKHSASGGRKLITAPIAIELLALMNARDLWALAVGAYNTVGPTQRLQEIAALLVGVEIFKQLHQVRRMSVCHD